MVGLIGAGLVGAGSVGSASGPTSVAEVQPALTSNKATPCTIVPNRAITCRITRLVARRTATLSDQYVTVIAEIVTLSILLLKLGPLKNRNSAEFVAVSV